MKKSPLSLLLFLMVFLACGQSPSAEIGNVPDKTAQLPSETARSVPEDSLPVGNTIATRFHPPSGFERQATTSGTYADYLRNLPLHAPSAKVHLYNGEEKWRQDVHVAVVNIDVGKSDLQQCADAVMRLRAEYLFSQKKYADIHFNFTNGFKAEYARWKQGERIKVTGNKCIWQKTSTASNDYAVFRKYMDIVFMYAGTLSLSKELKPLEIKDLEIGDIFIRGGSPGHAVIVLDMAVNPTTKEKVFLLAQSYMPAQEIHVLKNPMDKVLSPWYSIDFGETLTTPEWEFTRKQLMRF